MSMPESDDRRQRRMQITSTINARLIESGERDQLKELLRTRLVECGWRDNLKAQCEEYIKRKGLEKITVDDLVKQMLPLAHSLIPEAIKMELIQRLKKFFTASLQDIPPPQM